MLALRSEIAPIDRSKAEELIFMYHLASPPRPINTLIEEFMTRHFNEKAALLAYLYKQAIAEGVGIAEWDHRWAEFHYADNTHRFVQALTRWLDNN